MDPLKEFESLVARNVEGLGADKELRGASIDWIRRTNAHLYTYNFRWLGRPIIQFPQDMVAMQEIIWTVRPDLIIETGIAHGGSLIFSASMLCLLDHAASKQGEPARKRRVLGIDIDIRPHNRAEIEKHPLADYVEMMQGSSITGEMVAQVHAYAKGYERVLVCLDSNHTHDHVLAELEAYAPLTSRGSYCVVFDTMVDEMPEELFKGRPWGKGNNPRTAVHEYLRRLQGEGRKAADGQALRLAPDRSIEDKLLITVAPDGYLRRSD